VNAKQDQDTLFNCVINNIQSASKLNKQHIEPELERPKSFLKILDAEHFNWSNDDFRKVFGMRFKVKIPPIDQLNIIAYPAANKNVPIFIFFCMLTKRKCIAHLNVNLPFRDEAYLEQHVKPLQNILQDYAPFDSADRYPEWMKKYRNESTIYGLFPRERYADIADCAGRYAEAYMQQVAAAGIETDIAKLTQLKTFQDGFIDDIRTQDKAQGMISKMIGKQTAHRIFYEVTT
jgi:hypothetical protein